jgi:pimeloyl-ACP methyl ester carboxylesterase
MLGAYWRKLFQYNTWAKLGAGQLNTGLILRNLAQPVRNLRQALERRLAGPRTPAPRRGNGKAPRPVQPFAGFGGEVLLIHGEKDPETEVATTRLNALFARYGVAHQCVIIRGANHSFYSLAWENEIYACIEAWLNGKYARHERAHAAASTCS